MRRTSGASEEVKDTVLTDFLDFFYKLGENYNVEVGGTIEDLYAVGQPKDVSKFSSAFAGGNPKFAISVSEEVDNEQPLSSES